MDSLASSVLARGTAGLSEPAGIGTPARPGPLYVLPGQWDGLVAPGTIDLNNRSVVHNPDGTISTVKSVSFSRDGREILVPQVVGGRVVSPTQAWQHYLSTGDHLGVFKSPADATHYALALHLEQAGKYAPSRALQAYNPQTAAIAAGIPAMRNYYDYDGTGTYGPYPQPNLALRRLSVPWIDAGAQTPPVK